MCSFTASPALASLEEEIFCRTGGKILMKDFEGIVSLLTDVSFLSLCKRRGGSCVLDRDNLSIT